MSYSQNDEEGVILRFFEGREPGRFLDIGAHDGVRLSNTRALSDLGWTGTLVEPSPMPFAALMAAYRERAGCNLVHVAVLPTLPPPPRILRFHDSCGEFVSTFDEAHRELWEGSAPFQIIHVAAATAHELLDAFPGPYPFISLDVEGINLQVFTDLPLRRLRCELICIEYQDRLDEIRTHAASLGYEEIHRTSENAIFAVTL